MMIEAVQREYARVPEKTYFRIGEVAKLVGVEPYVLRFWETEFKAMIPPKSRSKQRMYRRRDLETILTIKYLLYAERFTIEGAKRRLLELQRGEKVPEPPAVSPATSPRVLPIERERLAALRAELMTLRELAANA